MSEMEQKKDSPPLDLLQFYGRSHIITLYPGEIENTQWKGV